MYLCCSALTQLIEQLKQVVQSLFNLIVEVTDYQGPQTEEAMRNEITQLLRNLLNLSKSASQLHLQIPPEVIEYVENGRNPDIYTREFAELVQKNNQKLKGRSEALSQFRDILARKIATAFPDMQDDVRKVVINTGGGVEGL
ncbi:RNA polymeras-like protein II mediator complex subunit 10 [Saccharata proteae CBS 121410]|uniref:Mediator of RNA polymerase II transcription subunit 10 n=1 Tax=Saccharata proteae CBS 121410 TaxID=1314787 RepID=A0A9P4I3W3_9PEZI|nr:RNA polymeras-like protein II mediator complex subunit 10 [Saccharata proteae CBS 121410]